MGTWRSEIIKMLSLGAGRGRFGSICRHHDRCRNDSTSYACNTERREMFADRKRHYIPNSLYLASCKLIGPARPDFSDLRRIREPPKPKIHPTAVNWLPMIFLKW